MNETEEKNERQTAIPGTGVSPSTDGASAAATDAERLRPDGTPKRKYTRRAPTADAPASQPDAGLTPPAANAEGSAAVPPTTEAEPPKRKYTKRQKDAPENPDAPWFSAEADRSRQARARENGKGFVPVTRLFVDFGETYVREGIKAGAIRDGMPKDEADARMLSIPRMADVPMTLAGRTTTVAEVQAESLAVITAYFVPMSLDHVLLDAGLALGFSMVAYSRAVTAAMQAK